MVKVFFSHTGNPIIKDIKCIECSSGSILDIINELNFSKGLLGIKAHLLNDNNKILSHVRIFKNIDIKETENTVCFYENIDTTEIRTINEDEMINDNECVLITLFQPEFLVNLINEGLSFSQQYFSYRDVNGIEEEKPFRPVISQIENIELNMVKEEVKEFKFGETNLSELSIGKNDKAVVVYRDESFDKHRSRLLPEEIVDAIRDIWELPQGEGKLRLFQEDALFFIMAKLLNQQYPTEKQLLLSMPTGGGKTEAFMIPIVSYIFKDKQFNPGRKGIKAIIIYPTNALANDQAMRFVELIYKVNKELKRRLMTERQITIGILSGDTPSTSSNLADESLIQLCPSCSQSRFQRYDNTLKCNADVGERVCGVTLDFCRLTKNDIVENPPDILITNPDEINFALHSPKYAKIFHQKIDTIVFDEVHMYQGIFGCHISHLLRRLEEISNNKPLYIGLSATIGNAQELASLLFNEQVEQIKYIHNKDKYYTTEKTSRYRYHLLVKPAIMYEGTDNEKYVRTMSVAGAVGMFIGHLVIDSHFRKAIIFANYRNDADDLAKYLKEREELDIRNYFRRILDKINRHAKLDSEEVEICLFIHRWINVIGNNAPINNDVIEIGWNRGGLEKEARIRSIHSFTCNSMIEENVSGQENLSRTDKPIDLMVATKTLEVGIDIGDVTTVINSSAPFTTNEYVQRVGRAGRKKDSLAITVVNPENAIDAYFTNYFHRYVDGSDFEDAPIIITNEIIASRHILARLLDYFTKKACDVDEYKNHVSVSVACFKEIFKVKKDGRILNLGNGVTTPEAKIFASALFEEIFLRKSLNDKKLIDNYIEYLKNEARVLGISETNISENFIRTIFEEKILEINKSLDSRSERSWENSEFVSGFNPKDKSLCPSLRGSGATVDLYLEGFDQNGPKDVVSRQTAFNSMPPVNQASSKSRATASSGISTFEVFDAAVETDMKTENIVKKRIASRPDCMEFFGKKFESFPKTKDPFDFLCEFKPLIPNKLNVRYFPNRFYCYKCEKGLKPPHDVIENNKGMFCKTCMSKVQQLPLVYLCSHTDGCGQVINPPIPKACINPECSDFKEFYAKYKANNFKFNVDMTKHFKFRMTRNLEWVCLKCGAKMNFSSILEMKKNNNDKKDLLKVINSWEDDKSPEGTAVHIKKNPELFFKGDHNSSSFSCSKCRKSMIKTVGVPRVRTVSFSYYGKGTKKLKPNKEFYCYNNSDKVAELEFTDGYQIQLAKDFLRRYTSGFRAKETIIRYFEIFEQNMFLSNYYDTHFAWIRLNDDLISKFLNERQFKCSGVCEQCMLFEDLDLGNLMKPPLEIESYNMDAKTGKPRKPDSREKYCAKALTNECTTPDCKICGELNRMNFLKYLIVHTLKHGILWALPKYAGVNVTEIRGELYPNDREGNYDIVLVDSNEGGSGAILLIEKYWKDIWDFAKTVINKTCENEANIILPHSCKRFNTDLCPFITRDFIEFLGSVKE